MDKADPVADWVRRWGAGDPQAAELLFARYGDRLTHVAEQHLSRKLAAREGGEDVVQSAKHTPKADAGPPLLRGVLGGGCARPGKANLRLIRRAIGEGWDIPEAKRRALVEHFMGIVRTGHARNVLAAMWCLIEADRANLRAESQQRRGG
jgi:hypothetical protein